MEKDSKILDLENIKKGLDNLYAERKKQEELIRVEEEKRKTEELRAKQEEVRIIFFFLVNSLCQITTNRR